MKREPILSIEQFVAAHEHLDEAIWRRHISAAGKSKLSTDTLSKLMKQNATDMSAINPHTRIAYAQSADHSIHSRLKMGELGEVFFVDVACKEHIAPISDIREFNLEALSEWMRPLLKGMNFFGALDAAYYYDGTLLTDKKEPAVCWHGHFMVWGVTKKKLLKRQTKTNDRFHAGWPGGSCFYFKRWVDNIDGRAMYMMKAPQSEYSVHLYDKAVETSDPETGEIVEGLMNKAKQYKRELRPGSLEKVVQLYAKVSMSDVLMAGGNGDLLLREITSNASTRLSLEKAEQLAAKANIIGLPRHAWPSLAAAKIAIPLSPVIRRTEQDIDDGKLLSDGQVRLSVSPRVQLL